MRRHPGEIAVFDFISHETMHLPFNEGYLRTLASAFPDAHIRFAATFGHVANLKRHLQDVPKISWETVPQFRSRFGLSRHNPFGGIVAARECLDSLSRAVAVVHPDLVVVLGFEAFLARELRRRAPGGGAIPFHLILHGTLGENLLWRSRNPFIRAFDMISEMKSPLAGGMTVVVPELGVEERLVEMFPHLSGHVKTLEHPILRREWVDSVTRSGGDAALRVAFLGNARAGKGFAAFAKLAMNLKSSGILFECIGHSDPSTDALDLSGLHRHPSKTHVNRDAYVQMIQDIDLVCMPFSQSSYSLTASGTLCDAIAMLKPVVAIRTGPLVALEEKYGPYGRLFATLDDLEIGLRSYAAGISPDDYAAWQTTLRSIRAARTPEVLAQTYP